MIISILLLIVGFVLLIKGADIFVDGASSTALNLKVSKMVIGYAEASGCNKIIIGDLKGIKEAMEYNKDFVQLPLQMLVQKIILQLAY